LYSTQGKGSMTIRKTGHLLPITRGPYATELWLFLATLTSRFRLRLNSAYASLDLIMSN